MSCRVCGEPSNCVGGEECPRNAYRIDGGCRQCGDRSSCPRDDSCPSFEARREELRYVDDDVDDELV